MVNEDYDGIIFLVSMCLSASRNTLVLPLTCNEEHLLKPLFSSCTLMVWNARTDKKIDRLEQS